MLSSFQRQVKLFRKTAIQHHQHHNWRRPLFFKLRKYKERRIINIFVFIISKANDLESRLLSFGPIAAKNGHPGNLQKTSTSSFNDDNDDIIFRSSSTYQHCYHRLRWSWFKFGKLSKKITPLFLVKFLNWTVESSRLNFTIFILSR